MDVERSRDAFEAMGRIASGWRRRASAGLKLFGITLAQYELISQARRRGGLSPSAAAAELAWDRPTLTVVARTCLARGWLKRGQSPQDKRSVRIELTGKGEEILDRIEAERPFADAAFGTPFDVIGAEERTELFRLLDRVSRRAADLWGR
ncbi:MAG: MarR family transcriptional regulator [Spirochaetota bacterium]